ncbi:hypothetical protein [Vibrio alfacsensis]|uniref:hypothetical protein n=1 Tax=Vibrio alfacsensis TaxID=1074311 RepID=UPI001C7F2502|nr:hypothetical protein [Vibrio alfacsensis]
MWNKLPDLTYYMGPWPKAIALFLMLIVGGHLFSVIAFGEEFLSAPNITGTIICSIIVGYIAYKQKTTSAEKENDIRRSKGRL